MRVARKLCWALGIAAWVVLALALPGQASDILPPSQTIPISVSSDEIHRATIILDSYSYAPNHLVVESGKVVELTLTSITTITPHNFLIKDLGGGVSVEQEVGAGKTVITKFLPTQPGRFPFFCDKRLWPMPSHRDKGMEGLLEVK